MENMKKFNDNNELDLTVAAYELWLNKWTIVFITFLALFAGIIYGLQQIPQYQSSTLIQIDSKQPSFGNGGVIQQLLTGNSSGDSAATQIALIQSRFVLEPVINSLGLNIKIIPQINSFWNYLFPSEIKSKVNISELKVPNFLLNKKLVLKVNSNNEVSLFDPDKKLLLKGKIGTKLISGDKSITLKIDSITSPINSQFVVIKKSDAKIIQFLLERLSIEEAGMKMRQNTGVLNITLRGDSPQTIVNTLNEIAMITQAKDAEKKEQEAAQTLEFLYNQMPITKKQLEDAEALLNNYRAKSGKINIKLQTRFLLNQLAELDKKKSELQINRIDMLKRYTNEHPTLIALNAQIKAIKNQQNKLESALKRLPASDQIAVNLMRDVKVKQALYMVLLSKIQELQVVKASTVSGVRILSYAKMPDTPLPSKKIVIYLSSILLGLMISISWILGKRFLYFRVDDPHWVEDKFNLPNLATVIYSKEQADSFQKTADGLILKNKILLAYSNPRSLAIESLRSLRTSLQVTLTCASNNIVTIIGMIPGVGKSFITTNLAYLLAAGGKKVLIIDTDLRRGTIHRYFNSKASPGLVDFLTNKATLDDITQNSMHKNLFYISRGDYPKDPSELLMTDLFGELIKRVSKEYDVIIIDTAPALLVTDALVVAGYSGTNYLVMGAGIHRASEIDLTIKRLSAAGVQLNGTIYNFHREASVKTPYYRKYTNYNYYYDESLKN